VAGALVKIARRRVVEEGLESRVRLDVGDMLAPTDGTFQHVVAMDSLLHYSEDQLLDAVASLAQRAERSVLITFAPRTPLLGTMHAVGRLFPRSERSPSISPMRVGRLLDRLPSVLEDGWVLGRTHRVSRGFYISQALELRRAW
jgi:magnesium-protoporphyrin O-methyltransferase